MSIAVIIPTYNRGRLLKRAIASIQRQQCVVPIRIVVVDDGSTDDTLELLDDLSGADSRLTVIHQDNRGVAAARNTGIASLPSETEFVAFLDSDDVMVDSRLSVCVRYLEQDASIGYVIGEMVLVDDFHEDRLEPEENSCMVRVLTHCVTSAVFRADIFKKVGLFDVHLPVAEDLDFFLRLAEAQIPYRQTDEPHFYYIRHEGDHLTKDKRLAARCSARAIAMSLSRRRGGSTPLLLPKFNMGAITDRKGDAWT